MDARFCDWCGQPAVEGSELCEKCAEAQRNVEAGILVPTETEERRKQNQIVLAKIKSALMLVGKGVAAMILAAIMVGAALFGTCSAIVTVVTVFNPFSAAAFLSMAAAGFGIAYLMYRLIRNMYKSPLQRLDKPRPPQIDKKD